MSIVRGKSGNRTPHNKTAPSFSSAENQHNPTSGGRSLAEVLSELRNLLDDYSPAWYTEEHQKRVESALHQDSL